MRNYIKCLICNSDIVKGHSFSKHLSKIHNVSIKQYYDDYLKKENEGICTTCGKETPFLNIHIGYQKHCSAKCAQNDPQVKNVFRTNNPQKNPEIRKKTIETCQKLYGGTGFCSDVIQNKIKQSKLNKYGVENSFQLPTVQQKARKNSHTEEANAKRELTKKENIDKIAKELDAIYVHDLLAMTKSSGWYQSNIVNTIKYKNHIFIKRSDIQTVLDYDNNAYNVYSVTEKQIVDTIKEIYNKDIIENSKKIISPKELDIYLPDLKLAIEYNGMYFHSSLANTPKDYHLNKSLMCREKGIRLIHIYEFEDLEEQKQLLKDLILGVDNYPKDDFNKNNLINKIPQPEIIYNDSRLVIYGAGFLK